MDPSTTAMCPTNSSPQDVAKVVHRADSMDTDDLHAGRHELASGNNLELNNINATKASDKNVTSTPSIGKRKVHSKLGKKTAAKNISRRGWIRTTARTKALDKRAVSFSDELEEVRFIDDNSTVSSPAVATARSESVQSSVQPDDGEATSGSIPKVKVFGPEHLPRRKELLRLMALKNELEEEIHTKKLGKQIVIPGPSFVITFRDAHSKIEFVILRSNLRADILEAIEAQENNSTDESIDASIISIEWATPAAVWLYVRFLRFGEIFETNLYGWEDMCKAYPPLRDDSYLNALLASICLARELEDEGFEKCVVAEIEKVVKASLGPSCGG